MQIISKGAPTPESKAQAAAQNTRERAIAKLMGGQAQQTPVADPNNVSPEEVSALAPSKAPSEPVEEETTPAEGQPTTDEGQAASAAPEAPKAESKEDPLSTQYAVLARKEKALRAKVQTQDAAIKAKEAEIAAREAAIKAKEAEYEQGYISKDKLKSDAWSTLQDLGVSYDDVTQQALASPQDPAARAYIARLEAKYEAKFKALEEKHSAFETSSQEAQKQQYQQALNQIRSDAKQLVTREADAYEMIANTDSIDDVVDLIERTFKEEGRVMTVDEAATEVENYLAEQAYKLAQTKKIQSRFKPAASKTDAAAPKSEPTSAKQPQKTLTNTMGAQRPLTAKERAILAFKGEKKN